MTTVARAISTFREEDDIFSDSLLNDIYVDGALFDELRLASERQWGSLDRWRRIARTALTDTAER